MNSNVGIESSLKMSGWTDSPFINRKNHSLAWSKLATKKLSEAEAPSTKEQYIFPMHAQKVKPQIVGVQTYICRKFVCFIKYYEIYFNAN